MKKRILDAASKLINRYGLRKFTMDEIAKSLGISKKTIYRYYGSKSEIVHAFFSRRLLSDRQRIERVLSGEFNLKTQLSAIIESDDSYRLPTWLLSEASEFYPDINEEIEASKRFRISALENVLAKAEKKGFIRTDVECRLLAEMVERIGGIFTDYHFLMENGLTVGKAADEAIGVFLNGILVKKETKVGK